MLKILTIAGSDSGGGAGIQADIKTIAAHRMFAMSVISALTAQNTVSVLGIQDIEPAFVGLQMDAVFTDLFPDAVKIGMLSNASIIGVVAERLRHYQAPNIVLDPVMISTSGSKLLSDNARDVLIAELFPLAHVITPNIPESEVLCGFAIENEDGMLKAAKTIRGYTDCAILIKGGHSICGATDLLYYNNNAHWFRGERINNPNTHGTGCTLSSAIACQLASGKTPQESIRLAKEYLTGAIGAMLNLGKGAGPVDHGYANCVALRSAKN